MEKTNYHADLPTDFITTITECSKSINVFALLIKKQFEPTLETFKQCNKRMQPALEQLNEMGSKYEERIQSIFEQLSYKPRLTIKDMENLSRMPNRYFIHPRTISCRASEIKETENLEEKSTYEHRDRHEFPMYG